MLGLRLLGLLRPARGPFLLPGFGWPSGSPRRPRHRHPAGLGRGARIGLGEKQPFRAGSRGPPRHRLARARLFQPAPACKALFRGLASGLTTHSSRRRSATRLNSGVRSYTERLMAAAGSGGFFVGWGTLSLINAGLAQSKGRSGLNWWLLSLLLGPVATLLIVVMGPAVAVRTSPPTDGPN